MSKRNSERQGYKETRIGWLPEHWEVRLLGDIGQSIIGLTYAPENVIEDGLLVLRSSNILEGALAFEDNVFVNVDVPDKLRVRDGDLLICVRNGSRRLIGKSVFIERAPANTTFGAFMTVYRSQNARYVSHLFQSDIINRQIQQNLGATINQITNGNLNSFLIPYPPLPEQRKIADILSAWDQAIELVGRQTAAKQRLKKALMQRLLTGKVRFPGFGGERKRVQLEDFLKLKLRKVEKPKQEYLRLGVRSHGKGTFTTVMEDPDSVDMTHLYRVKTGDVIVSITFAWEGAIAMVEADGDGALVSHRFPTFIIDTKQAAPEFFRYLMVSPRFFYDLRGVSPGGAGRNRVMSKKDFMEIWVNLPPLAEQQKIGDLLVSLDSELATLIKFKDRLQAQKRGLMQKLLTGEMRVRL